MIKLETTFTKTKEVSEKRLSICQQCEFYTSLTTRCQKCGCIMRFKTLLPTSKCPIEKWSKEENV